MSINDLSDGEYVCADTVIVRIEDGSLLLTRGKKRRILSVFEHTNGIDVTFQRDRDVKKTVTLARRAA